MEQKRSILYILKCTKDKYFVGCSTKTGKDNVIGFFTKNNSGWLNIYPPVDIIGVITDIDSFDEDKYTKIYMKRFGIDNVRGGSYTRTTLPKFQKDSLDIEFATAASICFICKKHGHAIYNCPEESEKFMSASQRPKMALGMNSLTCLRCGSDVHDSDKCIFRLLSDKLETVPDAGGSCEIPIMDKNINDTEVVGSPSVISQFFGYITGYSTSPNPLEIEKYKQLCTICGAYGHTLKTCSRNKKQN